MASKDVFGYTNQVKSAGQVASAEFAFVSVGSKQALVQRVSATYGQQIDTVTSVGNSEIYWVPGRPQGSLDITKLVGSGGFFEDWQTECGKIDKMTIDLSSDDASGRRCGFTASGSLFFDGGIIQRLSVELGTSQQTIAQSVTIQIASLSAEQGS